MYKKCLIVALLILISGNVINFTFQFYNNLFIFAQTNQAPEAKDQKVSVNANDKVKITLEGNDDDKDDKIQFDIVSDPSHGKLDNFDKSDGTVTYIPDADYSGNDGFKFRVIDDKGEQSDSADVEVEVKDVTKTNQETMTTGDETNQETMTTGDETNQETMTTGDETNQETMTTGDETNIKDENQTTRQFMQNNELSANDQSPIAYDQDLSIHMNEKTEITLTGKDDDNDPIQFAIVSNPTDASLDNFDSIKGTLTFVPETDYVGNESFAFKVIDDKGMESNAATVSVKVSSRTDDVNVNMNISTNQAPTALSQNVATDKNNQINITMTGKDDDNDPIQFAIVSKPTDASLDNFDTTKGTLTFVPETDYVGNESFGFKVIDDKGMESNVATVNVKVSPRTNDVNGNMNNATNQAPTALSQNVATDKNNQINITMTGKDDDNDPIQFAIVSKPTDASLDNFDTTKGTLTFVPETDYVGNESFGFKVIDDKGMESNAATVSVDVKENNQTNLAPLAFDESTNES